MKKVFVFFLICIISSTTKAQDRKITILGTVIDKNTKETLVGVNIIVTKKGTATDIDGKYALELPYGKHQITYKYIGYCVIISNYKT